MRTPPRSLLGRSVALLPSSCCRSSSPLRRMPKRRHRSGPMSMGCSPPPGGSVPRCKRRHSRPQAASARADAAGALPDPTFLINDDEIDRTGGPRLNKTYYMFGQTFRFGASGICSARPL